MAIPDSKSQIQKPAALRAGSRIATVSPSSPADTQKVARGVAELKRLGYEPQASGAAMAPDGFFAGTADRRAYQLQSALEDPKVDAVFCVRGGYGAAEVVPRLDLSKLKTPKIFVGHSDATVLQILLWQKLGWVTFYGTMVAAGLNEGEPGYDNRSLNKSLTEARDPWSTDLRGEAMREGRAEGRLLGGCITLIESTIGTPWELDTRDAILLLEDRGMRPFQIDRALLHLRQAGKLEGVRGIVLGEFPECDPPAGSDITARDACERVLGDLKIPILYGAPIGHTQRPMLTLPLGVTAWLDAEGSGKLTMEPAVA